jgi:hypothetical protein
MALVQSNLGIARPDATPSRYPVNIRITIPFFPRPFFLTLIIGSERRGRDRLREERKRHPLNTWGNLATFILSWTVFSVAALFGAFVMAGV